MISIGLATKEWQKSGGALVANPNDLFGDRIPKVKSSSSGPSSHVITSIILMIVAVVFAGAAVYATPQKKNPQTNVVTTYTVLTVLLAVSNLAEGNNPFITGVCLTSFLTSIILYTIITFRGGI